MAALTGSAQGRDGTIRVTVGSAGQVERLQLDDRVHELSGPRLAQEIMAVIRRAQGVLAGRVAEQVRETVGEDTEAGRAVLHSFDSRFPSTATAMQATDVGSARRVENAAGPGTELPL